MPKVKYLFRLRELMYAKYGEDKFALACIIVAQWINFEHRNREISRQWHRNREIFRQWLPDDVLRMASMKKNNRKDLVPLTPKAAEAIRQLFGLKSTEEIFND